MEYGQSQMLLPWWRAGTLDQQTYKCITSCPQVFLLTMVQDDTFFRFPVGSPWPSKERWYVPHQSTQSNLSSSPFQWNVISLWLQGKPYNYGLYTVSLHLLCFTEGGGMGEGIWAWIKWWTSWVTEDISSQKGLLSDANKYWFMKVLTKILIPGHDKESTFYHC